MPKAISGFLIACGRKETYSNRRKHILREEDTLRLNNEEVDELMNIAKERIKCLLGNSEVLLWAELGRKTLTENCFPSYLSGDSNPKSHPCELEGISQDIKVSGNENEGNDGEVGNAGGAWVIP